MSGFVGATFDVYVVGAEASAGDPAKVAAALASRLHLPAAVVTKGLTDRKMCAAQNLDTGTAQALVRELRGLGAMTMLRPSSSPPAASAPVSTPVAHSQTIGLLDMGASEQRPSQAIGLLSLDGGGPPRDPFAPPPSQNFMLALDSSAGVPPVNPPGLDLALDLGGPPPSRPAATRVTSGNLPGTSAMNATRLGASSSDSGLAVDSDVAANAHRVRCSTHGLFYDKQKASGCRKCLEPGRKMSAAMHEQARGFKLIEIEDNPVKRAFLGIAIALVVGFIPAAYHALRVGAGEMRRVRAEQEVLSRKPATLEIAAQFEELDVSVGTIKSRSMRNTGLLWMVVTGGALLGWYRVT
jgi:hypothetical protein